MSRSLERARAGVRDGGMDGMREGGKSREGEAGDLGLRSERERRRDVGRSVGGRKGPVVG